MVTWRGRNHVGACLDALQAQHRDHRVLVVDNASDDGTAAVLAAHPSCPTVVRLARNAGYAGGIAAALARVRTPLMAWLNDDARPDPGWLAALEDTLTDDAAAVAAQLRRVDGAVQSFGGGLTADGHGHDIVSGQQPPFAFCGGAALLRTAALRDVGGVPTAFFCYYEDTDTSWRLRLAGWRIVSAGHAVVYHEHGASSALGSPRFHRWNERNRLLMLLRCAPAHVVAYQLARFVVSTVAIPLRAAPGVRSAPNHRVGLRVRVLAELVSNLPGALLQRHRVGRVARVARGTLWRQWAGG